MKSAQDCPSFDFSPIQVKWSAEMLVYVALVYAWAATGSLKEYVIARSVMLIFPKSPDTRSVHVPDKAFSHLMCQACLEASYVRKFIPSTTSAPL